MDKAASQLKAWWQNHCAEDSVLKGLYQNKQAVSKPTFLLYPAHYCWIIVTAFPLNYLAMVQQSLCPLHLSDTLKNLPVEPGLAKANSFLRPLMQNENIPYSFIQMQLWLGRSSHCTATQQTRVSYGPAMLLSPFPYYNQGTCNGFLTCLPVYIWRQQLLFPPQPQGVLLAPLALSPLKWGEQRSWWLQNFSDEVVLFLKQVTNKANSCIRLIDKKEFGCYRLRVRAIEGAVGSVGGGWGEKLSSFHPNQTTSGRKQMWKKPQRGTAAAELTLQQIGESQSHRDDLHYKNKASNLRFGFMHTW